MNSSYLFQRKYLFPTLLLTMALSLCYVTRAQEYLTGVGNNAQIINKIQQEKNFSSKSKAEKKPLFLPFFEDFSNHTGFPDEKHFTDKQVFINNTYPLFPPSIGVATLDALDEYGEIYSHLNFTFKGADTLTSCFIRMDSIFEADALRPITVKDSIYFSFYFQPGGGGIVGSSSGERIGNQPDANDSLVLEFGYMKAGEAIWNHVWSTGGFSLKTWTDNNPYEFFKQVLIPITNDYYLCDSFRFRFRNYASLEPQQGILGWEGNVDQWHIDYIRIDTGRNMDDKFTNDLVFMSQTTSFLKKYQAVPWSHFQNAEIKDRFTNQLANISDNTQTAKYQYTITRNGIVVSSYMPSGRPDILRYDTSGIATSSLCANPPISLKPSALTDSAIFKVTHIFENVAGTDFAPANDTCVFEQKFLNYYAYDDGTAEYGYCINNTFNIADLAVKFQILKADQLSAVQMWFNHTKNSENKDAIFSIVIWKDDNGVPGEVLYKEEGKRPDFGGEFLDFFTYKFETPLAVNKNQTIWVGFQQQDNVQLNIGFDQNTDSREFFRFKTQNTWNISAYKGTPMIRPLFGDIFYAISENEPTSGIKVFPNPTTGELRITNYELGINNEQLTINNVEIFDVYGRKQKVESRKQNVIDISNLPAGIYFLRVNEQTVKIIKN